MTNDEFSFDNVEDLPEIIEEPNGEYEGVLTVTEAKPKKGSPARALRIKFATGDKLIFVRVGLTNNDGTPSYDAPAFKKIIKPFLEKANMSGALSNVLALFSEFPCKAVFRTDPWVDSQGVERTSVRLVSLTA